MSKSHNMPGWRMGCWLRMRNLWNGYWRWKAISTADNLSPCKWQLLLHWTIRKNGTTNEYQPYKNRRHLAEEIMKSLGCSFDPIRWACFCGKNSRSIQGQRRTGRQSALYNQSIYNTGQNIFWQQRPAICTPFALCQRKNAGRSAGKN